MFGLHRFTGIIIMDKEKNIVKKKKNEYSIYMYNIIVYIYKYMYR